MLACPPDAASCERAAPSLPTGLQAGRASRAEITAVELTGLAGDGLPAYTSLWAGRRGLVRPIREARGACPVRPPGRAGAYGAEGGHSIASASLTTAAASAAMALAVATYAKIAPAICSLLSTRSANDNALLATAEGGKAPAEVTTIGRFSQ